MKENKQVASVSVAKLISVVKSYIIVKVLFVPSVHIISHAKTLQSNIAADKQKTVILLQDSCKILNDSVTNFFSLLKFLQFFKQNL